MVDLLFVGVRLVVGLADTFGNDLGITFGVAGVLAIRALHAGRVFEEVSAECTAHDVIELLLDEFVALLLVDLFLLLPDRTLSVKTNVKGSFAAGLFLEAHGEMDSPSGFQRKPRVDHHCRLGMLLRILSEP